MSHRHRGFVISLELLLVLSFLLAVAVVGLALLRRGLSEMLRERLHGSVLVFDAEGRVVGKAIGFGEDDAPRILFRDPDTGAAAVLGVATDRFSSLQDVFYRDPGCRGAAFVIDPAAGDDGFSVLGALQGEVLAVGADNLLYRAVVGGPVATAPAASRWRSRHPRLEGRCQDLAVAPALWLLEAEVAVELDRLYRPPYVVATPSP